MKVIENERIIPAVQEKIIVDKTFIAEDGTEFTGYDAEDKCKKYEEHCEILKSITNIPYKKVDVIDDLYNADAFYIKNNEEFQTVLSYLEHTQKFYYGKREKENGFKEVDWYFFYMVYNDDYANDYPIQTLTYYKELIDEFLEQFN